MEYENAADKRSEFIDFAMSGDVPHNVRDKSFDAMYRGIAICGEEFSAAQLEVVEAILMLVLTACTEHIKSMHKDGDQWKTS